MDDKKCMAGFARLDITPPLGVPLGGGWGQRYCHGYSDPVVVDAVAFRDGEKAALLLVADLVGLGAAAEQWGGIVADKCGLPADAVMLCCTHCHNAPLVGKPNSDKTYDEWLLRRLCDAGTAALEDCKPVSDVRWAEERAEGLAFSRRFYLKNGTVMTLPTGAYQEQIDRPASNADDSLRLIRILREEGPEIVLGNFQAHPDNVAGDFISADFPGEFRSRIERLHENVRCVFINGAEGELVVYDRTKPREPKSHGLAVRHGAKLSEVAEGMFEKTVSTGMTGLAFGHMSADLKTKRDSSRYAEAKHIRQLFSEGRLEEIHPFRKQALYLAAEARQLVILEENKEDYRTTALTAIAFCGMALVGFQGEPFCEAGRQVRGHSKYPVTCVCSLTNGGSGYYFPMDECYDQGGYEVYSTPYVRGSAEQLVDVANQLLETL